MKNVNIFARQLYNDKIDNVDDVVYNKGYNIFNELYKTALYNYLEGLFKVKPEVFGDVIDNDYISAFEEKNIIIQKKSYNYSDPISIYIRSKEYPFTSYTVDLTSYWESYEYIPKGIDIIYNLENNSNNFELIYIDYVRNYAIVEDRYLGVKHKVALDNVPSNIKISKSFLNK